MYLRVEKRLRKQNKPPSHILQSLLLKIVLLMEASLIYRKELRDNQPEAWLSKEHIEWIFSLSSHYSQNSKKTEICL